MNLKQKKFLSEYLQCWNATKAAEVAGYKHPRRQGSRLLSNVDILKVIKEHLRASAMRADEVLARLAEQARSDISDFIRIEDTGRAVVDLEKAEKIGKLHLIKKIRYNTKGDPEIELHDAQSALTLIGKAHGLFKEQHEHSWREQAREDGVDPDVLLEQLIEQFTAAMVGAGGGGGVAGDAPQGGAGAGG